MFFTAFASFIYVVNSNLLSVQWFLTFVVRIFVGIRMKRNQIYYFVLLIYLDKLRLITQYFILNKYVELFYTKSYFLFISTR